MGMTRKIIRNKLYTSIYIRSRIFILGCCVVSLFHAFPESLVDSNKIAKDYEDYSKQMLHLMNESQEYHHDRAGFEKEKKK